MRAFIILGIIAALGFAAWTWYSGRAKAQIPTPVIPAEVQTPKPPPPPPPPPTPIPAEVKGDFDQAEAMWNQALAGGQPATSAKAPLMGKLYSRVLRGVYNKPGLRAFEDTLVAERLTPLGTAMFFGKTVYANDETGLMAMYSAVSGDSPEKIAKKHGMSMEMLNRLRGRDPNDPNLRIGEMTKVLRLKEHGGFFIHIDKSDYYLDCFVGGVFARRYEISHGAPESPTATGKTHLIRRDKNPSWTNPKNGVVYGPDDPLNILGKVWMKFDPVSYGHDGVGIHGYTGPDQRWKAMVSNGCIRLRLEHAQELFQTISSPDRARTEVEIVD
jgi:hypothetical protein